MRVLSKIRAASKIRSQEKGAAVVEAVLVTPLFLLIILGIIELGPAFLNWNGIHSATREGARVGSVSGAAPDADFQILRDVKSRMRASVSKVNFVIVFKATTTVDDPPADCLASARSLGRGVVDKCNVYYLNDFSRPQSDFGNLSLTAADANWAASSRRDWTAGPVDLVGVHINTDYRTLTGIIPSREMSYTTVFAIEATTGEGE
jgi:hypothetical protein